MGWAGIGAENRAREDLYQRHTSDPNSLKLTMYSKSMGVYNLYIFGFFLYR